MSLMMWMLNPIQTGQNMAIWMNHAFQSHPTFMKTLLLIMPVEVLFVLANNILWGLQGQYFWHAVTKPMPMVMIILATIAFIRTYGGNVFRGLVLAGLVLSLIADVLLIFEGEHFFLAGLAVFLVAHIMYIIAFSIPKDKDGHPVPWNYMRAVYFFALGMVIPAILTSKMIADGRSKVLVYSVVAYSAVISTMGWRAAARIGYPSESFSSQMMAFVGSIFFIISDTLLAFNRFYSAVPYEKIFVLTTYWIAQTMFVLSLQRDTWISEKVRDILHYEADKIRKAQQL